MFNTWCFVCREFVEPYIDDGIIKCNACSHPTRRNLDNALSKIGENMISKQTVNHPLHYQGKIEVIDMIESLQMGKDFCLGNVIKYVSRAGKKGSELEDLKKAQWYLNRVIKGIENDKANK